MNIDPRGIIRLVALQLGSGSVRAQDRLIEDLNASSVDIVNLTVALEDRFRVTIGEEDVATLRTVADIQALIGRLSGP